jgi:membrane protein
VKHRLVARARSVWQRFSRLPVVHELLAAYARANGLRFMRWAAAIALFGYLALFPLLVLVVMVFGMVLDNAPEVRADVEQFLKDSIPILFDPEQSQNAVNIDQVAKATTAAGVVSVVALVLTGLGWISASIEGVRRMLGAMHRSRHAIINKAQDAVILLVVGTVLLVALLAATLVQLLSQNVLEWLGLGVERARLLEGLAVVLSGAIVWLVLLVLFGAAWWRRPHRQLRTSALGSFVASVVLVVLAKMSVLVVGRTLSNPVYGTLAIAAALLLFLYIASAVMLYCASLVAVLEGAPPTQEEVAFAARNGEDIALPTASPPPTPPNLAGSSRAADVPGTTPPPR